MNLAITEDTSFDPSEFEPMIDIWLKIKRHRLAVHVNEYVSVSRLKTFEQCPQKFWFEYVAEYPRGENAAADFGVFLHAVLEGVYAWVVAEEFQGIIPEAKVTEIFRAEWEISKLIDPALYAEGIKLIRAYFDQHPDVDCWDILGIELPFDIEIEGRRVKGFIDRVDRVDHETIEIIDYKSNRQMFEREELEIDTQVSVYAIAIPQMFPWAKNIRFRFDMLRHGKAQFAQRTQEELEIAASYIASTANRTEIEAREWPAKLGFLCNYCSHRQRCNEYQAAITSGIDHNDEIDVSVANLTIVSRERERLHNMNAVIAGRVKELDKALKSVAGENGETVIGEYTYRMITVNKQSYDLTELLPLLIKHSGKTAEEILKLVTKVDKKAADELIKEVKAQWEGQGSRALKAQFAMELIAAINEEFWFSKFESRLNKNALRAPSAQAPEALAEGAEPKALPAPSQTPDCGFCQAKAIKMVERGGHRFAVCEEHKNKRNAPQKE